MLVTKETFEPNTTVPTLSPVVLSKAGQGGRGMARKIGRYLAEPAFIAGCSLAGALYAAQHDNLRGDNPVMGMAALAAHLATFIGVARLLIKVYRVGTFTRGTFGGFVVRCGVMLVCSGFELHGLSCWCDDVSRHPSQGMMKFE